GLGYTDALLNVQSDGRVFAGARVTVSNLDPAHGLRGDGPAWVVSIDLSGLAPNTLAVLAFDLLGFGAADSRVVISNVYVTASGPHNPVAAPDAAHTAEDTPVTVAVLANDSPGTAAPLDPAGVVITQAPQHGSVALDPATGQVRYTPAANYAGGDTFAYRVRDLDGRLSNEAAVVLTVTA